MKKVRLKKKYITRILFTIFLLAIITTIGIRFMPNVKAEVTTHVVSPGAGTLEKAIAAAKSGDILKLKSGSFTGLVSSGDKTVSIDKGLTIEGEGMGKTIIEVPLKITTSEKVTISDFSDSMAMVQTDFIYFKVDAEKADLNIKNVRIWGILRGDSNGLYPRHNATFVDISENANGANVTLQNCDFTKPGVNYGIHVQASNTNITLKKSIIMGRNAIQLENGSNNTFNVTENSTISGPSSIYTEKNTITIKKQTNLHFNVDNSKIIATIPSDKGATTMFNFTDDKSTNTLITIKNNSEIIDQDTTSSKGGIIFGFASNYTPADNNKITIDNTSKMYILNLKSSYGDDGTKASIPIERKYSVVNAAAIIGLYDKDGNGEIKFYNEKDNINSSTVPSLKESPYIEEKDIAGSRFKGWFKNFDGENYSDQYTKVGDDYPTVVKSQNMDLYPKFVKLVKVKFGQDGVEEAIEAGQNLTAIPDIDNKLLALKNASQTLKGYIMHGATGGNISETVTPENLAALKNIAITEDVTIEALHKVTVKVNESASFELEVGQTINELSPSDKEKYELAKLNSREANEFSRLVYKKDDKVTDETFVETNPINENIELVTKHYALVTFGEGNPYQVEEDKKISTNQALTEAMNNVKNASLEFKQFKEFKDSSNKTVTTESTITKTTTITPYYTIDIKIDDKTYTIDEKATLSTLASKEQEIKEKLQALITNAGSKNFKGFVLSVTNSTEKENLDIDKNNTQEKLIETILNKSFSKNTTIYAEYNAVVTIECFDDICKDNNTFHVDTGTTLAALKENTNYLNAKYQQYATSEDKDERFYHFVDEEGHEFTEDTEIEKSLTLTPKYFAYVTIEDERITEKKYYVEQGKTIEDLVGEEAQNALAILRSSITASEEDINGVNLHFDKLVDSNNEDLPSKITKDITIKGLYHYDVIIVEDYDNPENSSQGTIHEGTKGLKVYKDQKLNTEEKNITSALEKLKASTNKKDGTRKFVSYLESTTNKEFKTEEELLNSVFNTHIYITAKVAYKVVIGDTEDYITEGKTISESPELTAALSNLKTRDDKIFAGWTIDDKDTSTDVNENTIINKSTTINAKYNVKVTINNQDFIIPEGKSLSDYSDQTAVDKALKELESATTTAGHNFKGYIDSDGKDFTKTTKVTKNTTIGTKYNIKIIINGTSGTKKFEIDSGKTLADIAKDTKYKDDYAKTKEKTDRKFSRFVDEKQQVIDEENTHFTENTTLTPIFSVTITIKDKKYYVDENATMESNPEIIEALKAFIVEGKQLSGYVYGTNTAITTTTPVNDNITITPVYSVKLTIKYGEEIIAEFEFNENLSVNETSQKTAIADALNTLKNRVTNDGYNYKNLMANNKEFTLDTKITENTIVTAKYNIMVTINGANGNEQFEIESGQTLADVAKSNTTGFSNVQKKENRKFLYFVVSDGKNTILNNDDKTYKFTKNTTLTSIYAVTVTIDGKEYTLREDKQLSSNTKIIEALKAYDKKDKRVIEYQDINGNVIATVEEINSKTDKPITTNIELVPKYVIDIEIVANETSKFTVPENTLLKDLGYQKPAKFKRFVDFASGVEVNENTKLTKHTKLKVIFGVNVSINGNNYNLDAFDTFKDLEKLAGALDDLQKLKEVPEGRVSFSRFVYIKDGKEIELKDDTVITEDITVIPKFTLEITIVYTNASEEKEELVKIELEEGRTIGDLTTKELEKLNKKLREIEEQLEKEGKHSFKFSKFITEDNKDIDMKTTTFNTPTTIEAIFEYKAESSPVNPNNPNENNKYPEKEPAPNTGVENTKKDISAVIYTIITMLITMGGSFCGYKIYKKNN